MSFLKAFNFGKSKHKKLPEEWGESIKRPVEEGITFYVKYLGSTLVDKSSNETTTADAIKTIIQMAKTKGKKLQRVALTIKPTGIITKDMFNGETLFDISIYRISYCSADATFDRVIAFIATNKNETLECHAFFTSKRKVAQATALTISQAFSIAFDKWKQTKTSNDNKNKATDQPEETNDNDVVANNNSNNVDVNNGIVHAGQSSALIDFSYESNSPLRRGNDEFAFVSEEDLYGSFSRLAESRSNNLMNNETLLPTNLNLGNFQDLNQYIRNGVHAKDDKFFSDDVDELFTL